MSLTFELLAQVSNLNLVTCDQFCEYLPNTLFDFFFFFLSNNVSKINGSLVRVREAQCQKAQSELQKLLEKRSLP